MIWIINWIKMSKKKCFVCRVLVLKKKARLSKVSIKLMWRASLLHEMRAAKKARRLPNVAWPLQNLSDASQAASKGVVIPSYWGVPPSRFGYLTKMKIYANTMLLQQPKRSFLKVILASVVDRRPSSGDVPRPLPFLTLTTPLLVASSGLDVKLRFASIAQVLVANATRKSLLLIYTPWSAHVKGVVAAFSSFWRQINKPVGEIYTHPTGESWVADVAVPQVPKLQLAAKLDAVIEAALILPGEEDQLPDKEEVKGSLYDYFRPRLGGRRSLWRHTIRWSRVYVSFQIPHGFVKRKRARGIKKRLAKRITKLAHRRFWVV